MSDLDDFFAKKLDEEAAFPNRGKQWKQMSKRLDAFDAGAEKGRAPRLQAWQVATLAAVAIACFLFWKTAHQAQKVKALQQEVQALRSDQSALEDQLAAVVRNAKSNTGEHADNTILQPSQGNRVETQPSNVPNQSRMGWAQTAPLNVEKSISTKPATLHNDGPFNQVAENGANLVPEPVAQIERSIAIRASLEVPEADSAGMIGPDVPPSEAKVSEPNIQDSIARAVAPTLVEQQKKDTLASLQSPVAAIKPHQARTSRFRVGANAVLGFVQPQQDGVSAIKGQGFSFEAKIFRSLWATASVEWQHHEVSTGEFVPRFHPRHDSLPKPPNSGGGGGGGGGWSHPAKLVLVESTPREQHFGLGLRYQLPVQWWVRPSVRIAHEWARVSSTLITYKFEEDDPGPGGPGGHDHDAEYTAEKFDAQWLSNQWRFGIGLERDIPQWTFGLWADYSKDFSAATPSFDALYLRAGAQFRF